VQTQHFFVANHSAGKHSNPTSQTRNDFVPANTPNTSSHPHQLIKNTNHNDSNSGRGSNSNSSSCPRHNPFNIPKTACTYFANTASKRVVGSRDHTDIVVLTCANKLGGRLYDYLATHVLQGLRTHVLGYDPLDDPQLPS
jgi:hypothetical protein